MSQEPYLTRTVTDLWNPDYPQDQKCMCGHRYQRHFDTYDKMRAVGCKYCGCARFVCSTVRADPWWNVQT
jgi:hypothetical protein